MRWWIVIAAALGGTTPASARDALGIFEGWGAFRDAQPQRCFAVAEPARPAGGKWRPFASVAHWPASGVRSQLHMRLSRTMRQGAPITLTVDDRRWTMTGSGADVWAPSARHDAFIIAKMRSGRSMSIATVAASGGGFADTYVLKGAATAIDAAALGCARAR
jgi:hypothetical protein